MVLAPYDYLRYTIPQSKEFILLYIPVLIRALICTIQFYTGLTSSFINT